MNHPHLFDTSSRPQKKKNFFWKKTKIPTPHPPQKKKNSIRLGYWIRPMVSSHVSVDIPFHHHHCNRISSTAIGDWEEATSCIHRGWARVFMFFRSPDCSRFWRARLRLKRVRSNARRRGRAAAATKLARPPRPSRRPWFWVLPEAWRRQRWRAPAGERAGQVLAAFYYQQ